MPTKIFYNANINTFDTAKPFAQAMLIENGKIKFIGNNEEILKHKNDNIESINLNHQFVMPGFNDAHIHIWKVGDLKTFMADLRSVKSISEILQQLKTFEKNNPHLTWIMARGFNEANLKEKRMPTREDIDAFFPHKPVYIIRTCAHIAVVNSKAIEIAGITENTPVPQGGEIRFNENNKINGIFTETAKGLFAPFLPAYTPEAYRKMIATTSKELLSLGVTSATDPAVMPDLLSVYKALEKEQELQIRINAIPISIPDGELKALPLPEKYTSDFLVIDTLKFFADGGLSGQTAATFRPYKNTSNNYGVLRLSYDMFYPIALNARKKGWRIATHAIGDKALQEVLNVYAAIQKNISNKIYNRIEHLGLASTTQMQQIKDLEIAIVTQPIFIKELGQNFTESLDDIYLANCYAFKQMFHHQLKIAFSTDAPVVKEINPFVGIQSAIDRKDSLHNPFNPNENIDITTALKAYTIGSAIAQQEENKKGTLSANKYADFIVLNKNPFDTPITDIHHIKVLKTYVGGECKYQLN